MGAQHSLGVGAGRNAAQILRDECATEPRDWKADPGETFAPHTHAFHKVLFCVKGSITFHTSEGDIALQAGDRLDLEPETEHWATTGPDGVTCVEAPRS